LIRGLHIAQVRKRGEGAVKKSSFLMMLRGKNGQGGGVRMRGGGLIQPIEKKEGELQERTSPGDE